jgi:hypothetical protein
MDAESAGAYFTFFPILIMLFNLALAGTGIYCLILFIRLAHRGIKALDIYIEDKTNGNN